MHKICLLFAIASMVVSSIDAQSDAKRQHKEVAQEEQDFDVCRDGFFVRTIKKYPKLTAACVIVPFVILLWQNY